MRNPQVDSAQKAAGSELRTLFIARCAIRAVHRALRDSGRLNVEDPLASPLLDEQYRIIRRI
ncbi:hypothetical protein [Mycobacterium sp.]|uniref:hypothetical protein n=1 Tax=Mycobacterium sp. TaxID=1785 RepID=UPI00333EAD70